MKNQQVHLLEHQTQKLKKAKLPKIRGRKFNGAPYLNLKKIKVSSRHRIRQLLRSGISLTELKCLGLVGENSE